MGRREKMVQYVIDACNDKTCGYSQIRRWRNPDVDCSSLMYLAANAAGYSVCIGVGYTGTMVADFTKAGFRCLPFNGRVDDSLPGEIYLNVKDHTEMYIGGGKFGGAHIDENGTIYGHTPGDQTGNEVSIVNAYIFRNGWDYCLVPPDEGVSAPQPNPTPSQPKDIDTLAKEVIAGMWGNNPYRYSKIIAAGYDYDAIQKRVNEIIATGNQSAGNVNPSNLDEIAWRVIRGEFGNGASRVNALGKAGFDAALVQKRVNELLSQE